MNGSEIMHGLVLTRNPPSDWNGYSRRIDRELIADVAWPTAENPLVYICGPTGFFGQSRSFAALRPLCIAVTRFSDEMMRRLWSYTRISTARAGRPVTAAIAAA